MQFHHLQRQAGAQIPLVPVHHAEQAGDVVGQLRAAAEALVVDGREVILEADAGAHRTDRGENPLEHHIRRVGRRVVADEEGAAVEVQAAREGPPAHDADGVRAVAVLRARLRQVRRARLDVAERGVGIERERRVVEAPAALERVLAAGQFERGVGVLEARHERRRQRIEVVVAHAVIGRVVQRADEPCVGRDVDAALAHALAHVGAVGHVGEEPRVGTAAAAAAGAAVVR